MNQKYISLFNNGLHSYQKNNFNEALSYYDKVLIKFPDNDIILLNCGLTLFKLSKYNKAIKYYKKSYKASNNSDILINIADAYMQLNKFKKAIKFYTLALNIQPNNQFALTNIGLANKRLGKYKKSLKFYNKALICDPENPDIHWNIGHLLLLKGDYKKGLGEFEYRLLLPFSNLKELLLKYSFPLWQGESLNGKNLLIHPEQGFGDNIQLIRYVEILHNMDIKVFAFVLKEQKKLFSSIKHLTIIDKSNINLLKNIDYFILSMSLPYLCQTTINTIPNKVPYLFSKENNKLYLDLIKTNNRFKVGVAWQGDKSNTLASNRSIPISLFEELFKCENIDFYSIQIGEDIKHLQKKYTNLIDCAPYIKDFNDTALIMKKLDLVITIDSAIAHLSGALGVKSWILIIKYGDWRWLLNRHDSPWYPTAELFRQKKDGDWKTVIKMVSKKLKKLSE